MPNTSVTLSLDKRSKKNNNTHPIVLRLSHKRMTRTIALGYAIAEKFWDENKREVKKIYKGVSSVVRFNNLLLKKKADALDVISRLDEADRLASIHINELRSLMVNQNSDKDQDFFSFAQRLIDDMREKNQYGNARAYDFVLKVLKKFVNKKELAFHEIDYAFLMKLEKVHLAKGNKVNSLSVYMRTIRAIYNKGIKMKLVEAKHYPFQDYKIRAEPTRKRAISESEVMKLLSASVNGKPSLQLSQDFFACSYYLIGMNFKDLCLLKTIHVHGGRVVYKRAKTKQLFNIKISTALEPIIEKYVNRVNKDDYIFPIVKRNSGLGMEKDIEWGRKRHNKNLKTLAKMAGIDSNITSYVARHSFSTMAVNAKGIDIRVLQQLLGHKSISTTEVYVAGLPTEAKDHYQDMLFE